MNALQWRPADRDGGSHVIEVPAFFIDPPRRFLVDGREQSLGGMIHVGPRVADFALGPSAGRMIMRLVLPKYAINYRRARAAAGRRGNILATLAAAVFGGPGVAGGVATSQAGDTQLVWTIYSLTVDDVDLGSWVLRTLGGVVKEARLYEPGAQLPNRDSEAWP